jgi:hypothetical protein
LYEITGKGTPKRTRKVTKSEARVNQLWAKPGRTPVESSKDPTLRAKEQMKAGG